MIKILKKIPQEVVVACSGGLDSMVVTSFLKNSRRKIKLAYFNHDTMHSKTAQDFVSNFANNNDLELVIGRVKGFKGRKSLEEFWRDERYAFFNSLGSEFVITSHHLDDVVETWIMSSLHGASKLIPYRRAPHIYRPFLLTSRSEIHDYALDKDVEWIEDPSNKQVNFMRNYVRHKIIPHALRVNPGLRKVIKKKIISLYK